MGRLIRAIENARDQGDIKTKKDAEQYIKQLRKTPKTMLRGNAGVLVLFIIGIVIALTIFAAIRKPGQRQLQPPATAPAADTVPSDPENATGTEINTDALSQ